jgi:hypothetical protein
MKPIQRLCIPAFIAILHFFIPSVQAQLYVGGGPSMMFFGQETIGYGISYGLGTKIRYTGDSEYGISGSINYFFPHESTEEVRVPSISTGNSDDFTGSGKISMLHLSAQVNYFFGDPTEDVSLYGIAGIAYLSQKASFKLKDCNPALYECSKIDFSDKKFSGAALDIGFGLNVSLENLTIFAEGKYNLPWNETFATEKPDQVEAGVGGIVGVLFPITD